MIPRGLLHKISLVGVCIFGLNSLAVGDETKFRQVVIPSKDLSRLIPPNYIPVSRETLRSALANNNTSTSKRDATTLASTFLTARLLEGGVLQSFGDSYFEFEHRDDAPAEVKLAPFSLALSNGSTEPEHQQIHSGTNGEIFARVDASERIQFSWSLRANNPDSQSDPEFQINLPASTLTSILLVVPQNTSVWTSAGIQTDAAATDYGITLNDNERLVKLQLAAEQSTNIVFRADATSNRETEFILRKSFGDFRLSEVGVTWKVEFETTFTNRSVSPQFTIPKHSVVTSLRVDSTPARFTQVASGSTATLSIDSSAIDVSRQDHTFTFEGRSKPIDYGWNVLPKIDWKDSNVVSAGSDALLRVFCKHPLEIADTDNTSKWMKTAWAPAQSDQSYQFVADHWKHPLRYYLAKRHSQTESRDFLDVRIQNNTVFAALSCRISRDENTSLPIAIQLEKGWEKVRITVPASGRDIRIPSQQNALMIWPEANEFDDGIFEISISGQRNLKNPIPPLFLARTDNINSTRIATFVAPSGTRFKNSLGLIENQTQTLPTSFYDTLPELLDTACMFQYEIATPPISLERSNSELETQIEVTEEVIDERIRESYRIEISNCSEDSKFLDVVFPNAEQRNVNWRLLSQGKRNTDRVVTRFDESQPQNVQLQFERPLQIGDHIEGFRFVKAPSIAANLIRTKASKQRGILRIGNTLEITSKSEHVIGIPEPTSAERKPSTRVFRYDPVRENRVSIRSNTSDVALPVVDHVDLTVVADANGSQRILLVIYPEEAGLVQMRYPANATLQKAIQNSAPLNVTAIANNELSLQSQGTQPITLHFSTNEKTDRPGVTWLAPRFRFDNSILETDRSLFLNTGTTSLSMGARPCSPSHIAGNLLAIPSNSVGMQFSPGQNFFLFRTDFALAARLGISFLLIAMGWYFGRFWFIQLIAVTTAVALLLLIAWNESIEDSLLPVLPFAFGGLLSSLFHRQPDSLTMDDKHSGDSGSFSLRLILFVFFSASAITLFSQDKVHPILIPLENGEASDIAYISPELTAKLFERDSETIDAADIHFSSANFAVDLTSEAETQTQTVLVELQLGVRNPNGVQAARLPIAPTEFRQNIRRIDLLTDGDVMPIRWPLPDPSRGIVLQLNGQSATLRIYFNARVETQLDGSRTLTTAIPQVGNAELSVSFDEGLENLTCNTSVGKVERDDNTGVMLAELGMTDRIELSWYRQHTSATPVNNVQTRWYVKATESQITRELEIDCDIETSDTQQNVELIVDSLSIPLVTSDDWQLVSARQINSTQTQLTLLSLSERTSTIRLMWSSLRKDESHRFFSIFKTNILGNQSPLSDAIVAISLPTSRDSSFKLIASATARPSKLEEFLAVWNGQTGVIDRVLESSLPINLRFEEIAEDSHFGTELHRITIHESGLKILYELTVSNQNDGKSVSLSLPKEVSVTSVQLDGDDLPFNRIAGKVDDELLVQMPVALPEIIKLVVTADAREKTPRTFAIPRITPLNIPIERSVYEWFRTPNLNVQFRVDGIESHELLFPSNEQLKEGIHPVEMWELSRSVFSTTKLPGRLTIRKLTPTIVAETTTLLKREGRNWTAQVYCEFQIKRGTVDYFALEVPNDWFSEVITADPVTWMSSKSVNAGSQIIKLKPERASANLYRFSILGSAKSGVGESVSVPIIRVLDAQRHTAHFAVPNELQGVGRIGWEVASASETKALKLESIAQSVDIPPTYETYTATNPDYSATMKPVLDLAIEPTVPFALMEYYGDGEGHLRCHWDLIPDRLEVLNVHVPSSLKVIQTRVAGRPVRWKSSNQEGEIQIPLQYSQLPQSVDILLSLTSDSNKIRLPKVTNASVEETWFWALTRGNERNTQVSSRNQWQTANEEALLVAQIASAIKCLESTTEALQDRTPTEMANWLLPWRKQSALNSLDASISEVQELKAILERYQTNDMTPLAISPELSTLENEGWLADFVAFTEGEGSSIELQTPILTEQWLRSRHIITVACFAMLLLLVFTAFRKFRFSTKRFSIAAWSTLLLVSTWHFAPANITYAVAVVFAVALIVNCIRLAFNQLTRHAFP